MYKVSATMFYHFFKVSFPVGTLLYVFTWENLWCEPSGVKLLCVVDDTIYWSIYMLKTLRLQFYDVQKCNSVQIVYSTYVVQKAKLLNYFATALKYHLY